MGNVMYNRDVVSPDRAYRRQQEVAARYQPLLQYLREHENQYAVKLAATLELYGNGAEVEEVFASALKQVQQRISALEDGNAETATIDAVILDDTVPADEVVDSILAERARRDGSFDVSRADEVGLKREQQITVLEEQARQLEEVLLQLASFRRTAEESVGAVKAILEGPGPAGLVARELERLYHPQNVRNVLAGAVLTAWQPYLAAGLPAAQANSTLHGLIERFSLSLQAPEADRAEVLAVVERFYRPEPKQQ